MPVAGWRPDRPIWLLDHADILGGGQLFALRLARCVGDERELVVICPHGSELDARLRAEGFETRHAAFPSPVPGVSQARAALALRRVLREAPADAMLVGNTARAQAFAAAALAGSQRRAGFVHLMHERDSAERRSARFVHARFGALAVVGTNAARAYRKRIPGAPLEELNNFLDPRDLDAMVAARAPRTASDPPAIGFLGRLIPEKGALELVEELAEIGHPPPLVAGAPQDEDYARRVGERAELLGHVDDVAGFLARIDVLVVPSTGNEAQPTAILEALAAGRPVIVREPLYSPDFEGLPVLPYRDAASLAGALADLPPEPADPGILRERFGPAQAVAAIERASLARRP